MDSLEEMVVVHDTAMVSQDEDISMLFDNNTPEFDDENISRGSRGLSRISLEGAGEVLLM